MKCPECTSEDLWHIHTVDVTVDKAQRIFKMQQRRYQCSCGAVWADAEQREWNQQSYRKAR